MKEKIKKIFKEILRTLLMIIIGLLIFFSVVIIPIILGEALDLDEEIQGYIIGFLCILMLVGGVVYNFKKEKKLTPKEYWKEVIKEPKETIMAFFGLIKALGWFLLIIIGVILAGVIISYFADKIGIIPFLIIVLIIVIASRLERIEKELRRLRYGNKDRYYDDFDEF